MKTFQWLDLVPVPGSLARRAYVCSPLETPKQQRNYKPQIAHRATFHAKKRPATKTGQYQDKEVSPTLTAIIMNQREVTVNRVK